jgi:hypothetical protein
MLYACTLLAMAIPLLPMHLQSDEPNKPTHMTERLLLAAPLLTAR